MTKESKYHIENNRVIFYEPFLDLQSVLRNGASSVTDVTFEKGIGMFNGTSSYINIGNPVPEGSSFTIVARVKVSSSATGVNTLIGNESGGPPEGSFKLIYSVGTGWLAYIIDSGVGSEVATNTAETIGEWAFVVYKYDQSTRKCAVSVNNNAFVETAAIAKDWIYPTVYYPRIGANRRQNNGNNEQYFEGDIDLFTIYNYALTAEECWNLAH